MFIVAFDVCVFNPVYLCNPSPTSISNNTRCSVNVCNERMNEGTPKQVEKVVCEGPPSPHRGFADSREWVRKRPGALDDTHI